uniref:WRKY19-like zinc finger domain-containing protein n=1 Tax=Globisporangium ultimum (strain ATCC 200006 / CBS 805.95 / DAOM BR144) TaxID=431595 RepID=K3WZ71_GLOUD
MPPLKKKKALSANSIERKQLRCSYPDCPNLRRSAGFCNRHSGKMCNIHGCDKSALSRGKCPEHGGGSRCKKDGCSKFAQTRGLCKSHGGGRQCNISGCTKNAHQNRLCRSHGGGKRCDFYGCPKWAQRSGYCCAHTKTGSNGSSHLSDHESMAGSVASSPICATLPMPSPSLMSPHRLLSLLP